MLLDNDLLGFITMGESYHGCANELAKRHQDGKLDLRHDAPIYSTYAHAIELLLKAMLLANGRSKEDVKNEFGHGILQIYQIVKNDSATKDMIEEIREFDRASWRRLLRAAREKHIEQLGFDDPQMLKDFGVPDLNDIEQSLPAQQAQIEWISKRHRSGGSLFRYPETRYDRVPTINAYGLNECVVFRSADHFCTKAAEILSKHIKSTQH